MPVGVSDLCCVNSSCPDAGKRPVGNLHLVRWTGQSRDIRFLLCRTCRVEFSVRKGTPLFRAILPRSEIVTIQVKIDTRIIFGTQQALDQALAESPVSTHVNTASICWTPRTRGQQGSNGRHSATPGMLQRVTDRKWSAQEILRYQIVPRK